MKYPYRKDRGRKKATLAGKVLIGGSYAPYGYDYEDGVLLVNDYEADVVRLIFDLFVNQGYVIHAIARYLDSLNIPKPAKGNNHKGVTDKKRKRGWSDSKVGNILRNEAYIGQWYYNKTKSIRNPETGKQKKIRRPRNEWYMVEVPSIVDMVIFTIFDELF